MLKHVELFPEGDIDEIARIVQEAHDTAARIPESVHDMPDTPGMRMMTLDAVFGSVPSLDPPVDWEDVERIAHEDQAERTGRLRAHGESL